MSAEPLWISRQQGDSVPERSSPQLASQLFRPVGRRAVALDERIVTEIQALITAGRLRPGDRLPCERDLAQVLNVSRASLREALRRLAAMGLIEIRWGQGIFVRSADLDVVLERLMPLILGQSSIAALYEVRREMEGAAAEWAALRATPAERQQLQALTVEAVALRERLAQDAHLACDLDRRYHNLIAVLSHNPVLVRIMVSLLDLLSVVRQRSFAIPGRAWQSLVEHQQITAAILAGDPTAARQAMVFHLCQAEAAIQETLASSAGLDPGSPGHRDHPPESARSPEQAFVARHGRLHPD
jgi:GntR family transcriptional repressor for pyruvate dehydrogenase complex